jgi:hypothetical protein
MEFATNLAFENLRLTVYSVDQDGTTSSFPLSDLHKRGLPNCKKPARRRIETDLSEWKLIDGQAYLDAFGFKNIRVDDVNHQFFEVKSDRRTHVVPALALLKAIFRPTKYFLPEMFWAHAMDRQCRLKFSPEGASVEIDAKWASRLAASECRDWSSLFMWMIAYPSANSMAGSVHAQAMEGRFGLELPSAEMRIVLRGLTVGTTMFVTDVFIVEITPQDEPTFALQGWGPVITLFDRKVPAGKQGDFGSRTSQFVVPRHANGAIDITDAEWAAIEPIIVGSQKKQRSFELSQREVLNGVLLKLVTGTPWKEVPYTAGNWLNASSALRRWSLRGTFSTILSVLAESRNAP